MSELLLKSKFISAESDSENCAYMFRKTFALTKKFRNAELSVTARGIYEPRLNGDKIGDYVFAPGWTSYSKRLQVQSYDITGMLVAGENNLDILLGNGWYAGEISAGVYGRLGPKAIIASLRITYFDGTTEEIVTDGSWKYAPSPIQYADFYHGEIYDANVVPENWRDAVETDGEKNALIPQEGEAIKEIETLPAIDVIITPRGEKVIDFGQEITGYVQFRTVGSKGSRTVIDHAEVLDKFGNFYNENYREAKSRIEYITDGNSEKWYHPIFTFQGFRYIRLTEYPESSVNKNDFYAVVVHSEMKRTGYFACSDPLVNRLYQNVLWSQRDNFLDIPTDCPQRNERWGWTGDAQVFCRTAAYNFDVLKFFTKWLRDLSADQWDSGAVPDLVPSLWGDGTNSAFAWGEAAVVCPWELYKAYGNKELLKEWFPSMKLWVDFYRKRGKTPEDWCKGRQFGDWLGLDAEEGSYKGATDDKLLATAFAYYSTDILVKAGYALDIDVSEYESFKAEIKNIFQEHFVVDDKLLTCDTQTAYACALVFGLAQNPQECASRLAEKVRLNDYHIQTGFIGTAYIMDALSENGYPDVAYKLLLQKDYPSWLYSVTKGATTIWEHWDGIKPDGSMWSTDMNSFNHYAYGAVASWLYGTVIGIRPVESEPGYRRIRINPFVNENLKWAEGSLDTNFGTVSSRWEKTADGYTLTVTVPNGTEADVIFGGKKYDVSSGTYTFVV